MAQSAMPSMAGYDTGYAGAGYAAQSAQYAGPGAQYSSSPGATAAYGQAQFHDYRGTGGMAPYKPAGRGTPPERTAPTPARRTGRPRRRRRGASARAASLGLRSTASSTARPPLRGASAR